MKELLNKDKSNLFLRCIYLWSGDNSKSKYQNNVGGNWSKQAGSVLKAILVDEVDGIRAEAEDADEEIEDWNVNNSGSSDDDVDGLFGPDDCVIREVGSEEVANWSTYGDDNYCWNDG